MKWSVFMVLPLALSGCAFDLTSNAVGAFRDANVRLTDDAMIWLGGGISKAEWERRFGAEHRTRCAWYQMFMPHRTPSECVSPPEDFWR